MFMPSPPLPPAIVKATEQLPCDWYCPEPRFLLAVEFLGSIDGNAGVCVRLGVPVEVADVGRALTLFDDVRLHDLDNEGRREEDTVADTDGVTERPRVGERDRVGDADLDFDGMRDADADRVGDRERVRLADRVALVDAEGELDTVTGVSSRIL